MSRCLLAGTHVNNKVIIQWGYTSITSGSTATVTSPVSFTAVTYTMQGIYIGSRADINVGATRKSKAQFTFYIQGSGVRDISWLAVGY